MASGLQAFKDDGTLLLDTNLILYGLLKSGPLELLDWWGFHIHRSAQLDPTDESSYEYQLTTGSYDAICGISVQNSVSPVVFISGQASPCGEVLSGNTRTFYFRGVEPGARAYVFDLMRDLGGRTGMQCFNEGGQLTFTTDMPPLNIVQTFQPTAPAAPSAQNPYGLAYSGGSGYTRPKNWSTEQLTEWYDYIDIPHTQGDSAVYMNFTRGCGYGRNSTTIITGGQEGCGAGVNYVRFFFGQAAASTVRFAPNQGKHFYAIPTDRYPTALLIRTSDYPYPFN